MPTLLIRVLLFLSSYFPLTVIIFVLMFPKSQYIAIGILILGVLGVLGVSLYLLTVRQLNPLNIEIVAVRRRDGEAMSYIVTYLLPFLAVPFGSFQQGVSLAIFFLVLCVLYVSSDMIHVNPMLNLFRFHIYEVELKNGDIHSLIARRRVRRGQSLSVVKAAEDILLEVRR